MSEKSAFGITNNLLRFRADCGCKLSRGLGSMGPNPYSKLMYSILDYIEREGGSVKEGILIAYFTPDAPLPEIHNTLEVLKVSGQIERVDVANQPPTLRMKKKK